MAKKKSSIGIVNSEHNGFMLREHSLSPVPDIVLQQYADKLIEWSMEDDSIILVDWMSLNRVAPQVVYRWADRYEPLKDALEVAKLNIGHRREKFGLMKKFDSSLVEKTMPLYNKEYKEWKMAQNKIMAEQMNSAPRIVVLEKFPEKIESKNE